MLPFCKPDDLISVNELSQLPQAIDKKFSFVQNQGGYFRVYPDRQAIDQGYLNGRKLEIAYAASKADVYFSHIQGSARLRGQNGKTNLTFSFSNISVKLINWA